MFKSKNNFVTISWIGIEKIQKFIMATTSITIVAMIVIGVVTRYIFKIDFYGSEEIILMLSFWLYFMGAAQGSRDGSQISADILNSYIKSEGKRRIARLVKDFITFCICALVTSWTIQFIAWDLQMNPKSAVFRLPMLIPHTAVCLGFILMTLYHFVYLVKGFSDCLNYRQK